MEQLFNKNRSVAVGSRPLRRGMPLVTKIALSFCAFLGFVLVAQIVVLGSLLNNDVAASVPERFHQMALRAASEINEKLNALSVNQRTVAATLKPYLDSKPQLLRIIASLGEKGVLPDELDNMTFIWPDGTAATSIGQTIQLGDRDFFGPALQNPDTPILSTPVLSRATGKPVTVYARGLRDLDGKVAGLIAYPINLDGFANVIQGIKVGTHGYAWLATKDGTIIVHPDSNFIMKHIKDAFGSDLGNGVDALAATATGDATSGSLSYKSGKNGDMLTFFARLPGDSGWTMYLSVQKVDAFDLYQTVMTLLIVFLFVALAITILVSILMAQALVRPVREAGKNFRAIAEGDADLTRQILVRRVDEMGSLLLDFNAFVQKLRQVVVTLKDSHASIASVSAKLEENAHGSAASLQQISETIQNVQNKARAQSESASSSNEAVTHIAESILKLDDSVASQAASIVEASASIEEMAGTIESVSRSAQQMAEEFQAISNASREGVQIQDGTSRVITRIVEGSESLRDANNVIAGIAAQTNLLAMNAAIEAAHAGQAGRGFAVVADEIRKLAQTSADQSQAIRTGIKKLQESIAEVVQSSGKLANAFHNVDEKIQVTGDLVHSVSTAMLEQRAGSTQMLQMLESLNEVTVNVRTGSEDMKRSAETIVSDIRVLSQSSGQISRDMDEMAQGANVVTEAAQGVASLAGEARTAITVLESSVGRFKV